jgi:hypothetical protein
MSTLLNLIQTRGPTSAIILAKEIASAAESSAIQGNIPRSSILRKFWKGSSSCCLQDRRKLAVLSTFSRAMPSFKDQVSESKAIAKLVKGMSSKAPDVSKVELRKLGKFIKSITKGTFDVPDLELLTRFQSTASCVENSRSKGGFYKYIQERVKWCEDNNAFSDLVFYIPKEEIRDKIKDEISDEDNENFIYPDKDPGSVGPSIEDIEFKDFALNAVAFERGATMEELPGYMKVTVPGNRGLTAQEKWSHVCEKEYIETVTHSRNPRLNVNVIPEKGGKYRVATTGQAGLVSVLSPISTQLTGLLRQHPALNPIFSGSRGSVIERANKILLSESEYKIYSTDMSQATDLISHDVTKLVVNKLAKYLYWTPLQKEAALRSVGPVDLFFNNKKLCTTARGTQLGLPLSFCILCILHIYALSNIKSKEHRKSCCVFGDDGVMFCTDNEFDEYKATLNELGMVINETKTHVSVDAFILCGIIYRMRGDRFEALYTGKLSHFVNTSATDKPWEQRLDKAIQSIASGEHWQQLRARSIFMDSERNIVNTFKSKGVHPYAPRELYGLGLPMLKSRLPKSYRKAAAVNFTLEGRDRIKAIHDALGPWVFSVPSILLRIRMQEMGHEALHVLEPDENGLFTYGEVVQRLMPFYLNDLPLRSDFEKETFSVRKSPGRVATLLSRRLKVCANKWSSGNPMSMSKIKFTLASKYFQVQDQSARILCDSYAVTRLTREGWVQRVALKELQCDNLGYATPESPSDSY